MTSLRDAYETRRKEILVTLAVRLEEHLHGIFDGHQRIDRISVRAKSVDRFIAKAEKEIVGKRKYDAPSRTDSRSAPSLGLLKMYTYVSVVHNARGVLLRTAKWGVRIPAPRARPLFKTC